MSDLQCQSLTEDQPRLISCASELSASLEHCNAIALETYDEIDEYLLLFHGCMFYLSSRGIIESIEAAPAGTAGRTGCGDTMSFDNKASDASQSLTIETFIASI